MKTRSGHNQDLRGLRMGALSAASIGLLGLGLAHQSSTMLATADSALNPSAQTALRGGENEADEAGSSEKPVMSMTLVPTKSLSSIEYEAMQEVDVDMFLALAQFLLRKLGETKSLEGNLPAKLDEDTTKRYLQVLDEMKLTPQQLMIASDTKDCKTSATFDYLDPKGKPKPEPEVMTGAGDVFSPSYKAKVMTLFTDTEYEITMRRGRNSEHGIIPVNRPMSMIARFRSRTYTRCIVFTLPYKIDEIAAQFRCSMSNCFFDPEASLPELQMKNPAPMPFTFVVAYDGRIESTEVKLGDNLVVNQQYNSNIVSDQSLSFKDLPQVIKQMKEEAKIPQNHKLVIAYVEFLNPITDAITCGLLSDLTIIDNLREQKGFPESLGQFDVDVEILHITGIYVDCKYSLIMQNHLIEAFNMLEALPILNEELKTHSASLLKNLEKAAQEVA